jgi:hypothetical protein
MKSNGLAKVRVNVELPDDFSMDQTLSLYLLDTLPLLDREAPDYALDVVTLIEAILEDPDHILRAQLNRLKGQRVAELKAEGMEYHDRMEELEKLEHPKPRREFVYDTFNAFAAKHPWVGSENIRPKSIAREMFEEFRSFSDYIRLYELQRVEGLLLRHLNGVYKVLRSTVPTAFKTEPLEEMEQYLGTMIRQVDSSLLDEWEKLRNPAATPRPDLPEVRPPGAEEAAQDVTRDTRGFTAAIRTRVFALLRAWSDEDFAGALEGLTTVDSLGDGPWTTDRLKAAWAEYHADHERIRLDPEARNLKHTHVVISEDRRSWRVDQVLVDPDEANDWVFEVRVDLAASRAAQAPHLQLVRIGPVGFAADAP